MDIETNEEQRRKAAMMELLEAQSKKRRRLSQRDKDWAVVNCYRLRGRGRPRKDEPADVLGGRAARK